MQKITAVYASDRNYAAITSVSAVSLLRHNPGARVVLLGYGLEQDAREIVRSRVESNGGEFLYCDVSASLERLKEQGCCGYTSYATYARIFIPEVLEEDGRVVYIDSDTLVAGSLDGLMSFDMDGKPFAIGVDCAPCSYKQVICHDISRPYCNAGIMVVDLAEWRRRRCTERFLSELANPGGPNPLGDQDIFARVFWSETAFLHPKYNFLSQFFLFSYDGLAKVVGGEECLPITREEYLEARRSPAIYHFSGHTLGRPWYTSSKHPMRRAYQEAAKVAGLSEVAEQTRPMPAAYMLQYLLHRFLSQRMFESACNLLYRIHVWWTYRDLKARRFS